MQRSTQHAPTALRHRRRLRLLSCLLLLGMLLVPHGAKAWWDDNWSFRKKITIDTGPKGAALPADAGRMPVLIRLHDGNFKFSDAKEDGGDIRFVAADDKTPLKFHIETYDVLLGVGLIWVDVPAVRAGPPIDILMYYGNAKAPGGGDAHATYDADTSLIYHFAEAAGPPHDQTANNNNAQAAAKSIDNALIGRGVHFDGKSAIALPASPSLAVAAGGAFSWSAWIDSDAPQGGAVLYARHDGGNALVIGLDQDVPFVSISNGATSLRSDPGEAITPAAWHHIAVTAADHVTLYVDGKPRATLAITLPALNSVASLGADIDASGAVVGTGFAGALDELEMAKVARGPGFVAAAVASQGPSAQMVAYGADEENAAWTGGYFGVILKSVTIDGWVVIGMLGVMAAISWAVMINKSLYINRVTQANKRFLRIFEQVGADLARLESEIKPADARRLRRSALYHISKAGAAELAQRMAPDDMYLVLSPEAIAAIRANLDRMAVYESQRLNALIVLLTIAISGGPFLGLLGTVVGVMITFAAIAASGDVNVNAIAPGIAAALVATVAGLAVAIPALFGYNYLIIRIKDVTTEMHAFIDEFVTKLAETYRARPEAGKFAAE